MGYMTGILFTCTCLIILLLPGCSSQVLNPPSFNLAEGKNINASATCGEDYVGKDGESRELYCKLVGANWFDNMNKHIFQGQACDYCDPNDSALSHKAVYAIDGTERWWQSPPLSRGVRFNEVNLTIDLGQVSIISLPLLFLCERDTKKNELLFYFFTLVHVLYLIPSPSCLKGMKGNKISRELNVRGFVDGK